MAIREVDLGNVRGDINDSEATFSQATVRANINSGEKGKTIFGKIKKWFSDMGNAAFCLVVNNATTTVANTVLDGRMGKTLMDKIAELNRNITQGGNGYSKLPDGTLIQYGFFGGNATTNSYKNATVQTTFNTAFSNAGVVSINVTPANANFLNGYSIDNIDFTGFRTIFAGAAAANTVYNCGFRWMAIGRWK